MSMKDLLEERQERKQLEAIALELGISADDLAELDWTIEPHASADGLVYGHNIYFAEGSDPEILSQIKDLTDGRWIRIGPI
jgi:hypothetical protein